ncbi:MAG TPA: glycosyltransferase [Actinobacteria bacterium]|nr:glycosyltransferase [Actinomycetota bacterium]
MDVDGRARILTLIPAFNEEASISSTIQGLRRTIDGVEIVVVDDGSEDDTAALAEAAGASVMQMPGNLGKGAAVNRAFTELDLSDDDVLLLIDADLGDSSAEGVKLVSALIDGEADMVIAIFDKPRRPGGFGLVKGLARWGIKRLGSFYVQAPLSGQRAMKASLFREVGGLDGGYGMETGLTIDALRLGYKIKEVSTKMSHNETGRDIVGFTHRGRQFKAVASAILKRALRLNTRPNKAKSMKRTAP